jgi:hypothetical protein
VSVRFASQDEISTPAPRKRKTAPPPPSPTATSAAADAAAVASLRGCVRRATLEGSEGGGFSAARLKAHFKSIAPIAFVDFLPQATEVGRGGVEGSIC